MYFTLDSVRPIFKISANLMGVQMIQKFEFEVWEFF